MNRITAPLGRLQDFVETQLGLSLARGGMSDTLRQYTEKRFPSLDEAALEPIMRVGSEAFQDLVNALTVQHSWLFRDLEQLEAACSLLPTAVSSSRPAQVWVPACANGEDAFSVLALADALAVPTEVLGTDINARAIGRATEARYGAWSSRDIPTQHRGVLAWASDGTCSVVPRLRTRARFAVHNLLDAPPRSNAPDGLWDLILCRNVLIYMAPDFGRHIVDGLRDSLPAGGVLVLGASDILTELPPGLEATRQCGRLVFRRSARHFGSPPTSNAISSTPPSPIGHQSASSPPTHSSRFNGSCSDSSPNQQQSVRLNGGLDCPFVSFPAPPSRLQALRGSWTGPPGVGAPDHGDVLPESKGMVAGVSSATKEDGGSGIDEDAVAAAGHLLQGIDRHLAGELREAIRELRAALYLVPTLWPAAYYLALSWEGLGQQDDARRSYCLVLELLESHQHVPKIPDLNFRFLEKDVAEVARRRTWTSLEHRTG